MRTIATKRFGIMSMTLLSTTRIGSVRVVICSVWSADVMTGISTSPKTTFDRTSASVLLCVAFTFVFFDFGVSLFAHLSMFAVCRTVKVRSLRILATKYPTNRMMAAPKRFGMNPSRLFIMPVMGPETEFMFRASNIPGKKSKNTRK